MNGFPLFLVCYSDLDIDYCEVLLLRESYPVSFQVEICHQRAQRTSTTSLESL